MEQTGAGLPGGVEASAGRELDTQGGSQAIRAECAVSEQAREADARGRRQEAGAPTEGEVIE